ncbi:MAG TPA: YCF48-related protein [Steroidobacteraceae bacterium]|nr:YCF48-related protein [Steroidobacteraceae bacterium]
MPAAVALVLGAGGLAAQAPGIDDPPAQQAPLASSSLLLDVTRAGRRLVAVGDRGHVLYSDDGGASWTQAQSVPTSAMLTGACFADAQHGWAVGHDEVVLRTQDGGKTWQKTHYAPEAQQPLLDVWFGDSGHGIAIGAYGSYYVTSDGGATWTARKFEPAPLAARAGAASGGASASLDESAMDEAIGSEFHLNQLSVAGDRLYIAAEAGRLFRSDDRGATWLTLPSPYDGSFFGVLPLEGNALLAFGLRGNLFRSEDAGTSWQRIPTGTVAMLTDGVRLDDGTVVIVGLSGTVLVSRDGGRTFTLMQQDDRKGLSAVVGDSSEGVIVTGEGGVKRISLASGSAS